MSLDPLPADVTLIPVQGRHHHVVTTRHGEGEHISQQRTTKRALRAACGIIDLDIVLGEAGQLGAGIAAGVRDVGEILAPHFPRAEDDQNELPDRLIQL